MSRTIGFCLVFMGLACSPASGQTLEPQRERAPAGAFEVGGYSYQEGSVLRGEASTRRVDFFSWPSRGPVTGQAVGQVPLARTYTLSGDGKRTNLLWTDGETCPQLYGVMSDFNTLATPRLQAPNFLGSLPSGARMRIAPPVSPEARVYTVRGRAAQADGAFAYVTIEAYGGLIAEWVIFARDQLQECWREGSPGTPAS